MAWIHLSVIGVNTWVIQFYLIETETDCESDNLSIFNISKQAWSASEFSHLFVALKKWEHFNFCYVPMQWLNLDMDFYLQYCI